MIEEWTPTTLAMFSLSIMAIPAALTVLAVIVSILIGVFIDVAGIDKESDFSNRLDKASGNVFYIAFLSVVFINVMAIGLFASGIWAVLRFFSNLVN